MANLITSSRLLLVMIVIAIAVNLPREWMLLNVVLLIITFSSDGLDGYVARKRGEVSEFGAVFDIAVDRIVELTLWVLFFGLGYVPLWVVILFITRGGLVDAMRGRHVRTHRQSPFAMMSSPLGKWLVAGRFMRGFYAVIKATTFCWLALLIGVEALYPTLTRDWHAALTVTASVLILMSASICVIRGVPVIVEFIHDHRP